MTDELFESFKREIQTANLQTALADFEVLVESYKGWRSYDPISESIARMHRFFERELCSNVSKRNAAVTSLLHLRSYNAAMTLKQFDSVVELWPKLVEEFEGKIKRARKPERKQELREALAREGSQLRVLAVLAQSATKSSCLVDTHFKTLVSGGGVVKSSAGVTVADKLRGLARARNRVFTRPSVQSFEEYISTTELMLSDPNLRKVFLTRGAGLTESHWTAYLAVSQKLIDELEVAVMVQSL